MNRLPNAGAPKPATGALALRLGASPQAVAVGIYLLAMVIGLVVALFLLFPNVDDGDVTTPVRHEVEGVGSGEFDSGIERQGARQSLPATPRDADGPERMGGGDSTTDIADGAGIGSGQSEVFGGRIKPAGTVAVMRSADSDAEDTSLSEPLPKHTLLLLILVVGALGASLHGLTSLVDYVGNHCYVNSWTMWYVLRPFVGAVLSLVFYFAGRAGIFEVVDTKDEFYGVLALAGLIGLFSKQALYKLSDFFDVLFQSKKGQTYRDQLAPVPQITGIEPAVLNVGASDLAITLRGRNFTSGSLVHVNGLPLQSTDVQGAAKITAVLDAISVSKPGELEVTVHGAGPDGGVSDPFRLQVVAAAAAEDDGTQAGEEGEDAEV